MGAIPLPDGSNAADMIRRLRAIDAEIFGTLYANAGIIGGDVTIEGTLTAADIISSVWESGGGTVPLSLPDAGATTGYAVEDSAGIAQFQALYASGANITDLVASEITVGQLVEGQIADNAITADKLSVTSLDAITASMGTLTVDSTLTMGTGGVLRTAASGQRLELAESFAHRINWYTADASESSPGTIFGSYAGSAGTGRLHLDLHSPQNTTRSTQTRLILKAQSASGASGPEVDIFATGTYNIQPVVRFQDFILRADDGTALFPAFSFNNDTNTGMYRISSDSIAMAAGATAYVGAVNTGTASTSGPFLYNLSTHASHPFLRRSTSTGQVFYDSSTRDIKENIAPLPRLGNIIDRLVPVSYTLIDDPSAGTLWGFVAEDVHDVVPFGTAFDAEGKVMNYENRTILAAVVQELKHLRLRVAELEELQ